MCTVTFIPTRNGILLSSNRDENPLRTKALLPMITKTDHGDLIYPTDGLALGTWIGVQNSGTAIVLLNSSATSHLPHPAYLRSRGLVVKAMLNSDNLYKAWDDISLDNVAPFTLVAWQQPSLLEFSWNGKEKHCTHKNAEEPHIWSSSTLYDNDAVSKRKKWFAKWLNENKNPDSNSLYHMLRLHDDQEDGFVMNRQNIVRTLSISLIEISYSRINFKYFDILNGTMALLTMDLKTKYENALLPM